MIDLHSHVLHGLDDGAQTLDDAVAIARAMAGDGVRVAVATPHVREDYPTTPVSMTRALEEVRVAVREAGVDLKILPGAEIALDALPRLDAAERAQLGLGGNPGLLLLEFPYWGWPLALERIVEGLVREGIVPLLAHPERNPDVSAAPERLTPLVRAGALVQVTAASVDGRGGPAAARCSRTLLGLGLVHVLASDAHSPDLRAAGMSDARRALRDEELGRWLTEAVPAALLAGSPVPPRPIARTGRRWWRR